jgi:hypothetical protein
MPPAKGKTDVHVYLVYLEKEWVEYAQKEAASMRVGLSELLTATLKFWKDPAAEQRGALIDLMDALRLDIARLQPALAQMEAISTLTTRVEQTLQHQEARLLRIEQMLAPRRQISRWRRWLGIAR